MKICDELRASILQAAIQGKLTKQLPEDGDCNSLLRIIKDSIANSKWSSKKEKPLNFLIDKFVDYDIPSNWCWIKLSDIATSNIGLTYSPSDKSSDGTIVLRSSNIQNSKMDYSDIVRVKMNIPDIKMCSPGDILMCVRNGSKSLVGKVALIEQAGMAFGAFMAIIRSICNPYLFIFFKTVFFKSQIREDSSTETVNQITQNMLFDCLVPLPPLAEQHRIVARVEELMAKIDELEKVENELEELKKVFPGDMKVALLQAAMQGKLTKQLPEDGDARDLLAQIYAEKANLIKEKKIKKEKSLSPITEEDKPFDIPDNWQWTRLQPICTKIVDGDHNPPAGVKHETPYMMLSAQNVNNGTICDLDKVRFLTEEVFAQENQRTNLQEGDILFTIVGTLGRTAIFSGEGHYCFQRSVSVLTTLIYNKYLKVLLDSPLTQQRMVREATGTAQKGFYLNQVATLVIPLPPLAEQKRIVEKLDKLLPLCDELTEEKLIRAAI